MSTDLCGVRCENPFFLSSSVVGSNYEMVAKAFDEGWAGVAFKTIGMFTPNEVSPRFSEIDKEDTAFVGFKNIEQISTYSLEENLDFFKKLKENYPAKVIIASIMGSNEDEWTKLASLCEKAIEAGADGLAAINTIKSIMNVDLNGFSTSPNVSGKSLANVPTTFSEMNQMYSACLLMPTMMIAWQKYAHEFMFRTKEQRI